MKNSQLNKVIRLVRRTGDRMIVLDNESESAMVVMDIDAYEKMLGDGRNEVENLSEEEMMEKINRDIARWRSYNQEEPEEEMPEYHEPPKPEAREVRPETTKKEQDFEPIDLTGGEADGLAEVPVMPLEETEFGQDMGKIENEEPVGDLPEEEEEKFYLEPVE